MFAERTSQRMGYRPDLPDFRDEPYLFRNTARVAEGLVPSALPTKVTVKKFKVPVVDQGYLGSCVGCSVAAMMSHVRGVAPRSELQIYYEARRMIGETHIDAGAYIRDGVRVISELGAGRKVWWPYDESKVFVDPLEHVDRDALKRRIFAYHRLVSRNDFRTCLSAGFPFVIGFSVFTRFMWDHVAKTGVVTLPSAGEQALGGHAVCVYGYDDDFANSEWASRVRLMGYSDLVIPEKVYLVRNSWGTEWGSGGDFAIDQRYLEHPGLAGDAWTIRKK